MSLHSDALVCLDVIAVKSFLLLLLLRAGSFQNMFFLTTALLTLILPISIHRAFKFLIEFLIHFLDLIGL